MVADVICHHFDIRPDGNVDPSHVNLYSFILCQLTSGFIVISNIFFVINAKEIAFFCPGY